MISYKVKGIILVVIISLASIMMPFSVYADSFEWYRVTGELMSSQLNNELTINNTKVFEYLFNYQYHVKFDDSYLGYAQISISQEYYDDTDNNGAISIDTLKTYTTPVKTYYVNSDEVVINLSLKVRISTGHIQTNYDPCKNFTPSVTVSNANVTKIGLISSIDEVISILSNIYTSVDDIEGLETNQLTALQNILLSLNNANVELQEVNSYLDTISKMRNYNVPIESLGFVSYMVNYNTTKIIDAYKIGYYNYPVFSLNTNDIIYNVYAQSNIDSYLVMFCRSISINNYENTFTVTNGNIINIQQIYNLSYQNTATNLQCFKITFRSNSNGFVTFNSSGNWKYIPVSYSLYGRSNYSTDFALLYGFSNSLLDNIQLIANGTSQSNSAASDLESEASEYSEIADNVIGVEEGLTSNFETEINKIDLNTGLNGFGGNFMTSATWVRTQFDRLTENTPYGSLVVYGLTLGFVLLMLGKVLL